LAEACAGARIVRLLAGSSGWWWPGVGRVTVLSGETEAHNEST
jgi:hypothetical protein